MHFYYFHVNPPPPQKKKKKKIIQFLISACVASDLCVSIFETIAAKIAGSIGILPRCALTSSHRMPFKPAILFSTTDRRTS